MHFDGFSATMAAPKHKVVAEITSIEWVTHVNPDGSPSNEAGVLSPGSNGLRVFPDAQAPGQAARQKVDVLVKLAPKLLGITIAMKDYDVDGPTDNDGPIDVDPVDTDVNNNDNFPTAGAPVSTSLAWNPTDPNGEIRAVFEIGWMQPGNNWRVAAAGRQAELDPAKPMADDLQSRLFYDKDGDGLFDGGATGQVLLDEMTIVQGIRVTPLLTVWRNLHLEVDSMGAVTGNEVSNVATNVVDNGNGTSTITLATTLPAEDFNRFEGGKLWDLVFNEFQIVSNTTTTVTVNNLPDGTTPIGGSAPVTLQDDDHLQDGQDVPMPDTTETGNAMAEAFGLRWTPAARPGSARATAIC